MIFYLVDDSNDAVDGSNRKDDDSANQDVDMQYDETGTNPDEPSNGNGNGSRSIDVDDTDGHSTANEREKINPFSNRSRNNFNSGNDNSGYGVRDSPAVIVNTNLLPFIQKLRDPLRKRVFKFSLLKNVLKTTFFLIQQLL